MSNERQLLRTVEFALETFIESGYFPNEQLLLDTIKELFDQPHTEDKLVIGEPVAWMYDHQIGVGYDKYTDFNIVETCARNLESENCINVRPLYLAPPKREPIEDGELEVWYSQHAWAMDKREYMWGFRDAEKYYGIGGGK